MTCMVLNCDNEADGVEIEYTLGGDTRRGRVCKIHGNVIKYDPNMYRAYSLPPPAKKDALTPNTEPAARNIL